MNITKISEKYIQEHPNIRNCLKNNLINFSSLARTISEKNSLKKKDFDAVLIACRRYRDKLKKDNNEKEILDLLKESKIEVKNKVLVTVLEKNAKNNIPLFSKKLNNALFRMVEGASAITIITEEENKSEIKKIFKDAVVNQNSNLVEVTLKSPKEIENIPGVAAFLYSLLAEYGINIVETICCWTDTIFIINEKDLSKVMELFRF